MITYTKNLTPPPQPSASTRERENAAWTALALELSEAAASDYPRGWR